MGREDLLEVWDGTRDPLEGMRRVGRPSHRLGTCLEVLPEVRDGSRVYSEGPGLVKFLSGDPYGLPGGSGGPLVGSKVPPGGSGGPSEGLEWLGRPSRRCGMGWEAFPDVQDGSGGPARGPKWVGRTCRRTGTGREALPEVSDWSVGFLGNSDGPPRGSGIPLVSSKVPTGGLVRLRRPS